MTENTSKSLASPPATAPKAASLKDSLAYGEPLTPWRR